MRYLLGTLLLNGYLGSKLLDWMWRDSKSLSARYAYDVSLMNTPRVKSPPAWHRAEMLQMSALYSQEWTYLLQVLHHVHLRCDSSSFGR